MTDLLILLLVLQGVALVVLWLVRDSSRALYVCVLLTLVPVGIARFGMGFIPASYLLIPGATCIYLVDRVLRRDRVRKVGGAAKAGLILALLFFTAVFVHYLRNPVRLSDVATFGGSPAGIHAWMAFVLTACVFVLFAGLSRSDPVRVQRVMVFLAWLAFGICCFGLLLLHIDVVQDLRRGLDKAELIRPSFYGVGAKTSSGLDYDTRMGGYRIGTLGAVASLLLMWVLALPGRPGLKLAAGVFCLAAALQGGGRGELAGTLLAVLAWPVVTRQWKLAAVFTLGGIAGLTVLFVMAKDVPLLFRRPVKETNLEAIRRDVRVELFEYYIESFKQHPYVGVGIRRNYKPRHESGFVGGNAMWGGHGTYISLLYLFGLAAFVPFIGLLGLSLFSSYRVYWSGAPPPVGSLALFCFLCIVNTGPPMVIGGDGSEPVLFMILGIATGLAARTP